MPEAAQQSLFAVITKQPGVVHARLVGPTIGAREVPIITDLVAPAIEKSAGGDLRWVVLDMSSVTFVNSMGLGMCIDFRNRANKAGAKTILYGMNQQLMDLFKMVKVDRLFTIVKDMAELAKYMK